MTEENQTKDLLCKDGENNEPPKDLQGTDIRMVLEEIGSRSPVSSGRDWFYEHVILTYAVFEVLWEDEDDLWKSISKILLRYKNQPEWLILGHCCRRMTDDIKDLGVLNDEIKRDFEDPKLEDYVRRIYYSPSKEELKKLAWDVVTNNILCDDNICAMLISQVLLKLKYRLFHR